MRKFIISSIILLSFGLTTFGQNTRYPWAVGVGMHWADFWAVPMTLSDQLTDANWQNVIFPSHLTVTRNLNKSFNLDLAGGLMKLNLNDVPPFIVPSQIAKNDWKETYWDVEAALQYKLANGYILKEGCVIDPFIFAGVGMASISEVTYATQNTGIGLNIWPTKKLGINFTGAYNYVFDFDDYFHYALGLKFRFGKEPDQDGDGIPDSKDDCPTVKGLVQFNGCPDSDGDGVKDINDKCPNTPSTAKVDANGCPMDTDGDGVADYLDKCPTTPRGVKVNQDGCVPDTDGDGITDDLDKCANTPKEAKVDKDGCPLDTDKDGVADYLDKCPGTPVQAKVDKNGCPIDTDGDGIADFEDKCPTVKGIAENKGCPEIKKEEKKVFDQALEGIQFETASATIKKISIPILENVVQIMKDNPAYKLEINGHTDDVGDDAKNLTLSQQRSDSVKKYLTDNGIEGDRLTATGFGETKPIADNSTKEGKAKNRRVEFKVVF